MADGWLIWLGAFFGLALAVLCALAGYAFVGLFLGAVITLAARSATAPAARAETDETLRGACNRLRVLVSADGLGSCASLVLAEAPSVGRAGVEARAGNRLSP